MDVAKIHQAQLQRIKKNIKESYDYNQHNVERFNRFRRFVFESTMTDADRQNCSALKRPEIEFNILEPFVNRQVGEFYKQEPSIEVRADDGSKINPQILEVVEGHIRHIFFESNKEGCQEEIYKDQLSGGFGGYKVYTDYPHYLSHNPVIRVEKIFDPTMMGFDPLAKKPHKGDGQYCFELYPKTKEDILHEHPDVNIQDINFTRNLQGFSFSYTENKKDIVLLCDYYEKKKKMVKVVRLANGETMTYDEYKKMIAWYEENQIIEQPPVIVGKPRMSEMVKIVCYRIIENQVLEYFETDLRYLPLVFVDGNSMLIKENQGNIKFMTRPAVYNAMGAQKLKNLAGQSLANEIENTVQAKWVFPKESLPDERSYLEAITQIQVPGTIVYKGFKDNDPNVPNAPPQAVQRTPMPPEIMNAFISADQLIQNVLGSYDSQLGINDNQLSGVAIVEGATQNNATGMPYVISHMHALNQVANIIVDLIPKLYVTPRTIPITLKNGKKDYIPVNQEGGIDLYYDENVLQVKVEAGVNFAIQKSRALQQIIGLMQASQLFAQFMNEKGLQVLLDNLEIKGIDVLKTLAEQFSQEMQQKAAQAQQMAMQQQQNDPMVIMAKTEQMKVQLEAQNNEMKNTLKNIELSIMKQRQDTERLKVMIEAQESQSRIEMTERKYNLDEDKAILEAQREEEDMQHRHAKEYVETHHAINQGI